jgi:ribosome-associated protein
MIIRVTPAISIDESEIREHFIRASGPGGQNVNKVATAVQLRFNLAGSPSLPRDVRERLVRLAGRRMTEEGILVIEARRFRTQERNRQDALDRLIRLIQKAAEKPKTRRKTRPTPASKKRRLDTKHKRSETKRMRKPVSPGGH